MVYKQEILPKRFYDNRTRLRTKKTEQYVDELSYGSIDRIIKPIHPFTCWLRAVSVAT